jgi:hypothetical protein
MKKLSLLFVAVCLSMPMLKAAFQLTGAGTAQSPYQVASIANLREMRDSINSTYNTSSNIYRSAYYQLAADLDYTAETVKWAPISSGVDKKFTGTFDGNGKAIKGLYIGTSAAYVGQVYAGLFGVIDAATIKNLSLTDFKIYTKCTTLTNSTFCTGGIAGTANTNTNIYNCSVTGKFTTIDSIGGIYIGGLCGKIQNGVNITNCWTNVALIAKNVLLSDPTKATPPTAAVKLNAGGITGAHEISSQTIARPEITNCYSLGGIRLEGAYTSCIVGGIVGNNTPNITNCVSYGVIKSTNHLGNSKVGGIGGLRGGATVNCVALNDSLVMVGVDADNNVGRIMNTANNQVTCYALASMLMKENNVKVAYPASNYDLDTFCGLDLTEGQDVSLILNGYIQTNATANGQSLLSWTAVNGIPKFTSAPTVTPATRLNKLAASGNGMYAYSKDGSLYIAGAAVGQLVEIYTTHGVKVSSDIATADVLKKNIAKGVYIVRGIKHVVVNK